MESLLRRLVHPALQACGNASAQVRRLLARIGRGEPSPTHLPIIGKIDRPTEFALAEIPVTIGGWAAGPVEVSKIELFIDDVQVGAAVVGVPRPAIARAHPNYRFAATSGFGSLKHVVFPAGRDTVRVTALVEMQDGRRHQLTRALPVFASSAAALDSLSKRSRIRADSYIELAQLLIDAHELKEAQVAVDAIRTRFPDHPGRYVQEGRLLTLQGRNDEADALLAAGVKRFPENAMLLGNYARAATRRRDWQTALARWQAVRERFPDFAGVSYEEGRARLGVATDAALATGAANAAAVEPAGAQDEAAPLPSATHAALMLRFESLGANCEFGLVQRHFGSEPLGLLRFANTSSSLLLKALDNRFEGVGAPAFTKFELREARGAERAEYWVWDTRYNFSTQTYVYADAEINQQAYEKMYRQQCRRLVFLKEKLISDLDAPEKIFVYQQINRLSDDEIASLLRAIRKYGPGVLLCVRPEEEHHPAGSVEKHEDGLLIGYLDRFFSGTDSPAFDSWLKLCLAVGQL